MKIDTLFRSRFLWIFDINRLVTIDYNRLQLILSIGHAGLLCCCYVVFVM